MDRRGGVRTFGGKRDARIRYAFRRTWRRSRPPPSDNVGPPNRCSALDGCRPFGRGTVGRLTRDDQLRTVDTRRATSLTRVCVRDALNTSRACISARSSVDRRSSAPTNCVRPVRSGSRSSRGYIVESAHKRLRVGQPIDALNSSHSPGTPLSPVAPIGSNRRSVPVASSRTVRVTTI